MKDVTAEEIKAAVAAAKITYIEHHPCGGCGQMVFYTAHDGELLFHPACGCTLYTTLPERRSWQDAADWVNMQSREEARAMIKRRFGLE